MAKASRTQKLDKKIDDNLRRVYQEVVQEEVPERFIKLLEQLRQQDSTANASEAAKKPKEAK